MTSCTPEAAGRFLLSLSLAGILIRVALFGTDPPTPGEEILPWPIDLNRAGAPELSLLPGIGPSRAAAIVDSRARHGLFTNLRDLDRVPGIGPALLERLERSSFPILGGNAAEVDSGYNGGDAKSQENHPGPAPQTGAGPDHSRGPP